MSLIYTNPQKFNSGIHLDGATPLDDRLQINDISDIYISNTTTGTAGCAIYGMAYDGMVISVVDPNHDHSKDVILIQLKDATPYKYGSPGEVNENNYTEYWTVSISGDVSFDTSVIDASINHLESTTQTLNRNYTTLNNKVNTLNSSVNTLDSDINNIQTDITSIKQKNNSQDSSLNTLDSSIRDLYNKPETQASPVYQKAGQSGYVLGDSNDAPGENAFAEGEHTQATNEAEHASGKYNKSTQDITQYSVGIGTADNARKNALEITVDGSIYVKGIGGYDGTNIIDPSVKSLNEDGAISVNFNNITNTPITSSENGGIVISNINPEDTGGTGASANEIGAVAEGLGQANGFFSHAEGASMAVGMATHSEGYSTMSLGAGSHSEGTNTCSMNRGTHTEGYNTYAIGAASHAEGFVTWATGMASHTEGCDFYDIDKNDLVMIHPFRIIIYNDRIELANEGDINIDELYFRDVILLDGDPTTSNPQPLFPLKILYYNSDNNQITIQNQNDYMNGEKFPILKPYMSEEGTTLWCAVVKTGAYGDFSHSEGYLTSAIETGSHSEGIGTNSFGAGTHAEGNNKYKKFYEFKVSSDIDPNESINEDGLLEIPVDMPDYIQYLDEEESSKLGMSLLEGTSIAKVPFSDTNGNTLSKDYFFRVVNFNETIIDEKYKILLYLQQIEQNDNISNEDISTNINVEGTVKSGNTVEIFISGAIGIGSHTEGCHTIAFGPYSHAEGYNTYTTNVGEHATGTFNKSNDGTLFSVGMGFGHHRANAIEITSTGYVYIIGLGEYYGDGIDGATSLQDLIRNGSGGSGGGGSTNYITHLDSGYVLTDGNNGNSATGNQSFAQGYYTQATGDYSHTEGKFTVASGQSSHTEGDSTIASGTNSHAEGRITTASGNNSHTEGNNTIAYGISSHAEGNGTIAYGNYSHAEGSYGNTKNIDLTRVYSAGDFYLYLTELLPPGTIIEYFDEEVTKYYSMVDYSYTEEVGEPPMDDDDEPITETLYVSHLTRSFPVDIENGYVNCYYDNASGNYSHIEGLATQAQNTAEHASGKYNKSSRNITQFSVGVGTSQTDRKNAFEITKDGSVYIKGVGNYDGKNVDTATDIQTILSGGSQGIDYNTLLNKPITYINSQGYAVGNTNTASGYSSFAEGQSTTASGAYSHAEGYDTSALGHGGSHAEGTITIASGYNGAHAEGANTTASGNSAHAEGTNTTASSQSSHAEGYDTKATAEMSHAEGYKTTASGNSAHAEGYDTSALGHSGSHAEGDRTIASGYNGSHAEGSNTTASGVASHAEGSNTIASGAIAHSECYHTTASGNYSHAEGMETFSSGNFGAHAEGYMTIASGEASHAEGSGYKYASIKVTRAYTANSNTIYISYNIKNGVALVLDSTNKYAIVQNCVKDTTNNDYQVTLYGSFSTDIVVNTYLTAIYTVASGYYSHVEGSCTIASGYYSHAEGYETIASGDSAHAEGRSTTASGVYSHAEGYKTTASGNPGSHAEGQSTTASGESSHAEGFNTTASGNYSHAEGRNTQTTNEAEHAEGSWNLSTPSITKSSIGIGTSETNRKNAFEVTIDGSIYIRNIGNYNGTNLTDSSVKCVQEVIAEMQRFIDTYIANH